MSGKTAYAAIEKARTELNELSLAIWKNPEGPYVEHIACDKTAEMLKKYGFDVEVGVAGVDTAIKATWGSGKPVIGFLGEYDALPGMSQEVAAEKKPVEGQEFGHGCGHNLLGVSHVGAVIGLKAEMEERGLPGTIIYYGCSAEEVLTGKGFMARDPKVFEGLDASIAFHPMTLNIVTTGNSLALNSVKFHFKGITAHAGGDPHNGRSALDAVELTNVGCNYLREHVTTDVRMHYVITDGGTAPNIVPDYACVWYYVRAPRREIVEEVYARLVKVAEGAAHMTETKLEVEFMGGCYETMNNHVLVDLIHKNMKEAPQDEWSAEDLAFATNLNATTPHLHEAAVKRLGLSMDTQIHTGVADIVDMGNSGSTDVGDVHHMAPGVFFTTACYNIGAPGHSWQITSCSGSPIGEKGMTYGARAMAKFGLDLIENPEILEKAWKEFDESMGGKKYKCPIPADLPVPGKKK